MTLDGLALQPLSARPENCSVHHGKEEKVSAEHSTEEWLTEAYDYQRPRRGQLRRGVILKLEEQGAVVDVGLKRDGLVPRRDIERLGKEAVSQLEPGQEVVTRVLHPRDRDGNLILSLYQARLEKDWAKAQEFLESGEIWHGQVTGDNRGGLLVTFDHLRAFIPASHLWSMDSRRLPPDQRQVQLKAYVGQELPLKVIEVNRDRRRLILSERLARQQLRKRNMERLLSELEEGRVCQGTVRRLCDFGAFVDIGGAEGLVHLSELAWRRVQHPSEVLQVGDEVGVQVLRLDHKRRRISLSLKRLQPSPWDLVDETYTEGQLVSGVVTNVVDFGAFVVLSVGVEGLVHVSELAEPPPAEPRKELRPGDELVLRVLRIDLSRRRIALSLKRVSEQQREEWLAQQAYGQVAQTEEDGDVSSGDEPAQPAFVYAVEEAASAEVEQTAGASSPEASSAVVAAPADAPGFWTSLLSDEETDQV